MVTSNLDLKILGLGRYLEFSPKITNIHCTAHFAPPEVAMGTEPIAPGPVGVYCIGVALFMLASGGQPPYTVKSVYPFEGGHVYGLLGAERYEEDVYRTGFFKHHKALRSLPRGLIELIWNCLDPESSFRPTLGEMMENEWVAAGPCTQAN